MKNLFDLLNALISMQVLINIELSDDQIRHVVINYKDVFDNAEDINKFILLLENVFPLILS